jgi:trans-aconitate 2-methyltransferase
VIGIDTSAEMLRRARARLPELTFIEANVAHWVPPETCDVLFANAVFQWVPGHLKQLQRLLAQLPSGGVLAVQIPDSLDEPAHVLMREVAQQESWREQLSERARVRDAVLAPTVYYDALSPICTHFQIWHTVYYHVLESSAGVVEWVKGTGLRRFLDLLEPAEAKQFLAEYTAHVAAAYLPQADGKVIFRFPRIFIVAVK